ncbi:MAG: hypothetical protein ABI461_07715, partial [Polyangiaceae bacterium]
MTISDKCANCGGQLPPFTPGQTWVTCHFCGQRAAVEAPRPVAPHVVIMRQPQMVHVQPVKASVYWSLFWLLPAFFAVLMTTMSLRTSKVISGVTGSALGTGGSEDFQWVAESPFAAKINADATEDFVGHYRVLDGSSGKTSEFIGGFDGAKLVRIWSAGPYGDGSDTRGFHFAVIGNNVLVTDEKSVGHILDVTTGKETASIVMSDRADSICVEPTGKPEAWIHVTDNEDLDVDFTTKRTKKLARPAWCKAGNFDISDIQCHSGRFTQTVARCSGVDSSFKAPNFSGERMLSDGTLFVVVGEKSPGTRIPTAVGWDPKAKRILWQRPIPQT